MKKFRLLTLAVLLFVGVLCFSGCKFNFSKTYTYQILSGSMEPTLQIGDKVKVERSDEYVAGDIIGYYYHGLIMIHRVIYVLEEDQVTYYICRGDNVQNLDGTSADGEWLDDASYIQALVDSGATRLDIIDDCGLLVQIITIDQIQGVATKV